MAVVKPLQSVLWSDLSIFDYWTLNFASLDLGSAAHQVLHLDFWLFFPVWYLFNVMILRKKSREYWAFAAFTVYEVLTSDGEPRNLLEIIMVVAVTPSLRHHPHRIIEMLRKVGQWSIVNGGHLMALIYLHHQQPS